MIDKLSAVENRFEQISIELTRPETINDTATFTKLMKEHSEIYPIVEKFREYKKALEDEKEALEIIGSPDADKDFKDLAEEELKDAKKRIEETNDELKILLLPKDPNDSKNVIIEIRAGAGGEESALFAASHLRKGPVGDPFRRAGDACSAHRGGSGAVQILRPQLRGARALPRGAFELRKAAEDAGGLTWRKKRSSASSPAAGTKTVSYT